MRILLYKTICVLIKVFCAIKMDKKWSWYLTWRCKESIEKEDQQRPGWRPRGFSRSKYTVQLPMIWSIHFRQSCYWVCWQFIIISKSSKCIRESFILEFRLQNLNEYLHSISTRNVQSLKVSNKNIYQLSQEQKITSP